MLLATLPSPVQAVQAEPVTFEFFGRVISVTDGTFNTLDLRDTYFVGDAMTMRITIDRSTAPDPFSPDEYSLLYYEVVTSIEYTLGSPPSELRLGWESNVLMSVDRPVPPIGDVFSFDLSWPSPILGETLLVGVGGYLWDLDGTAFASTSLPGTLPALSEFEERGIGFSWYNRAHSRSGRVRCTIDSGATPVRATSWGRVKGRYRGP